MEKQCDELRGILLFRGCVRRSSNSYGQSTTRPTKKTPYVKHYKRRQKKGTPNDEYEIFVEAHLEAASKCIPTKPRTKYRVIWETLAVREKRALVKTASKSYQKNPTNTNTRKLEKAQHQLTGIYLKEQAK